MATADRAPPPRKSLYEGTRRGFLLCTTTRRKAVSSKNLLGIEVMKGGMKGGWCNLIDRSGKARDVAQKGSEHRRRKWSGGNGARSAKTVMGVSIVVLVDLRLFV
jgi:hypothetical protein